MSLIENHLNEALSHFVFSGYQLYIEKGQECLSLFGGKTSYWPLGRKLLEDDLFDIGSITKVVATTSIIARLVERGALALTDCLGESIPAFKSTRYGNLTVEALLTHSAGLVAWRPIFHEIKKQEDLIPWFLSHESEAISSPAGVKVEYSDLGFLLLGLLLEARFGRLSDLFNEEVVRPLNLKGVSFGPMDSTKCVATEYLVSEKICAHGVVFDENARKLGGVAAHAGLFSSARSLAPWCREWLSQNDKSSVWLKMETKKLFIRRRGLVAGSDRGLGFDLKSKLNSTAGTLFSEDAFGHLGYTGCSVWMDPSVGGFAIFLTNRVHPSRVDERIRTLRPVLHDAIYSLWRKK